MHEPTQRALVESDALTARRRRLRLEPGLAEDDADRGVRIDGLLREEAAQDGHRRHARGSRPDALGLRQELLGLEDLLILGIPGHSVALPQEPERPSTLLATVPRAD